MTSKRMYIGLLTHLLNVLIPLPYPVLCGHATYGCLKILRRFDLVLGVVVYANLKLKMKKLKMNNGGDPTKAGT